MRSIVLAALGKALPKLAKKDRGSLKPGEYKVKGTVTLAYDGKVKVSEDESYIPTVSIPLKTALALFLRYSGVTGPAARDALIKAMTEALEIEKLSGKEKKAAIEAIREVADLDAAEKAVRAGLDELPLATRDGKVTANVDVEEIEVTRLEKEAA
jgi:hypothetical protein